MLPESTPWASFPPGKSCRDRRQRSAESSYEFTSGAPMISKPLQFRVRRRGRERCYRERDHRIPGRDGKPFNAPTNAGYGERGSFLRQPLKKQDTSLSGCVLSSAWPSVGLWKQYRGLVYNQRFVMKPFKHVTIRCELSKLVIRGSFEDNFGQILFRCYEEQLLEDLAADRDPPALNPCQPQTPNIVMAANECSRS